MALGSATHLWVLGTPSAETLRGWVLAGVPAATEADLIAMRLGARTLLSAVNTSDREAMSRSIDVVSGVDPVEVPSVFIGVYPDHDQWELVDRGQHIETEERARAVLSELVPLELERLHDYVEWAHELEDVEAGAPAPGLGVPVELLTLGLPPGRVSRQPPPAVVSQPPQRAASAVKWMLALPFFALALAGPPLAWWHLLPSLLSPIEPAGIVMVLVMESAFLLPFALVWRRLPWWGRGLVVGVHLLSFVAGLSRL